MHLNIFNGQFVFDSTIKSILYANGIFCLLSNSLTIDFNSLCQGLLLERVNQIFESEKKISPGVEVAQKLRLEIGCRYGISVK